MGCTSAKLTPGSVNSEGDDPTSIPTRIDFRKLMKSPEGRACLLIHAQKEHSDENLLFYENAQRFRGSFTRYGDDKLDDEDLTRMRRRAEKLVDEFLAEGSERALNLPSDQLLAYKRGLKHDMEVRSNMFDKISRTVYQTIELDTFSRFKQSSSAQELLAKLPHLGRSSENSKNRSSRSTSESQHSTGRDNISA